MIFITQIPRNIYEEGALDVSASYNDNNYIISDTVSIPCIKEKINYNDTLDLEINQIEIYLPVTGSQINNTNNSSNGNSE